MITHYHFLAARRKEIIIFRQLLISQCLFMYAHAEKYYSSAKKITQFKFSSFQENILCNDNRYLHKEKR